ncbi:WD40 repeat domain-containing protein [Actinosynnema sp. NPDC023587]|uniref:WD40 repeat domain-containing protein n=1 Tax=Actinosynnema sp. NPDC023587 TaxID=3154695 RepID=UPI0033DD3228
MADGSENQRYNPVTYVAVGDRDTVLYSFDPFTGSVVKTGVPAFPNGYDALGHDWTSGKLYGVSGVSSGEDTTLVVIDPAKSELTTRTVSGIGGTTWVLGAVANDGQSLVLGSADGTAKGAVVDLRNFTAQRTKPAGDGGWYDWAYHPADGRLYAADGDTGDLLYADPDHDPQKTVLARAVFPKAQGGRRPTYSAAFFQQGGWFHTFDTAGNVYRLDLSASTAQKPVTEQDVKPAKQVGNVPIQVEGLAVKDAAGDVIKAGPPAYQALTITQKFRGTWGTAPEVYYSFGLTITATVPGKKPTPVAVDRWRILFDTFPHFTKVIVSGADPSTHGKQIVVDSQPGQKLAPGESRNVDLQVVLTAPLPVPPEPRLDNLEARNLKPSTSEPGE